MPALFPFEFISLFLVYIKILAANKVKDVLKNFLKLNKLNKDYKFEKWNKLFVSKLFTVKYQIN